jgi:hypothetical protein
VTSRCGADLSPSADRLDSTRTLPSWCEEAAIPPAMSLRRKPTFPNARVRLSISSLGRSDPRVVADTEITHRMGVGAQAGEP